MTSYFDLFVQTPRVIIKRYRSCYNVTLYAFHFFGVLLAIHFHCVHLRSESNELVFIPLFPSFIKPDFLFTSIPYALSNNRCFESIDIAFHRLVTSSHSTWYTI